MHAYVYVCACIRVWVHVYMYIYVYMYVCVYVCIYIYIRARVGVHMHSCRRILFICTVQSLYYMCVCHRCFLKLAILDHGGDVFEHPHAGSNLVGLRRKHANTADSRRLVKTFKDLLEIAP